MNNKKLVNIMAKAKSEVTIVFYYFVYFSV